MNNEHAEKKRNSQIITGIKTTNPLTKEVSPHLLVKWDGQNELTLLKGQLIAEVIRAQINRMKMNDLSKNQTPET